jgi:hypothetical protein
MSGVRHLRYLLPVRKVRRPLLIEALGYDYAASGKSAAKQDARFLRSLITAYCTPV